MPNSLNRCEIGLGVIAVPYYFVGLILIALGQIAINTAEPKEKPSVNTTPTTATEQQTAATSTPAHTQKTATPPGISYVTRGSGTIVCSHCKTKQNSTRNVCWNCGAKFVDAPTSSSTVNKPNVGTWQCPHCNTTNSMNYSQCKKCGKFKS